MTTPKPSKRDNERFQLDAFRQVYSDFPKGRIRHGDKPDVIVEGIRKIGIEITVFDMVDGQNPDSERQQSLRRNGAIVEAQKLYLESGGKAVKLIFDLDNITAERRKILPVELANFARKIEDKIKHRIVLECSGAPSEVRGA